MIDRIKTAINTGKYRITKHAVKAMQDDNLDLDDVLESVNNGKIIEDYPEDKRGHSCLVYGDAYDSRPVHSLWGMAEIALVTVYAPDPDHWINFEIRKKK